LCAMYKNVLVACSLCAMYKNVLVACSLCAMYIKCSSGVQIVCYVKLGVYKNELSTNAKKVTVSVLYWYIDFPALKKSHNF
jgi:hypothetical protein